MRNELEQMALIERYLSGACTPEEQAAAEKALATDAAFREAVEQIRELQLGIHRSMQRERIHIAARRFTWTRIFTRWILPIVAAMILVTGVMWFMKSELLHSNDQRATTDTLIAQAEHLPAQVFAIHTERDTVVECLNGLLLLVPAHCWLHPGSGQPVAGTVQLVIKEALDAATIMKAGLSTFAGDSLLESGGMFAVAATAKGETLTIHPDRAIVAEVPADNIKPGMQLFKGEVLADGTVNWKDPKPLLNDLVPVPARELNFYPPGYLQAVALWGYDAGDKRFTDSLYYATAAFFRDMQAYGKAVSVEGDYGDSYEDGNFADTAVVKGLYSVSEAGDTVWYERDERPVVQQHRGDNEISFWHGDCAIDPAKVKTISSGAFDNTLIATREFEARMPFIHQTGNTAILDLYIKHLDKPLSEIDRMAAKLLTDEPAFIFEQFALRNNGKVPVKAATVRKLAAYYTKQSAIYRQAISRTNNHFLKKYENLRRQIERREKVYQEDSVLRGMQLLEEETALNMRAAYLQLGYDTTDLTRRRSNGDWLKSTGPGNVRNSAYRAVISSPGWYNVDKYVTESVVNRTTMNFTDSSTGKKAQIKYNAFSVKVAASDSFERLHVYLLPNKLSSFMRLKGDSGLYKENLNEQIRYTLVCIGYKGEEVFFASKAIVAAGELLNITLQATNKRELDSKLKGIADGEQLNYLKYEQEFFRQQTIDRMRLKMGEKVKKLQDKVSDFIYPCMQSTGAVPAVPVAAVPITSVK